mmetsp:Transcript_73411/g.207370  ORF Transcript_73411/g.207370 Transcript_73411/m.207370 type:complete len:220 (-) Transcript_73411:174-833(-)
MAGPLAAALFASLCAAAQVRPGLLLNRTAHGLAGLRPDFQTHKLQIAAPAQGPRPDGGWNYDQVQQFLLNERDSMKAALEKFKVEVDELQSRLDTDSSNGNMEVQSIEGSMSGMESKYNKCLVRGRHLQKQLDFFNGQMKQVDDKVKLEKFMDFQKWKLKNPAAYQKWKLDQQKKQALKRYRDKTGPQSRATGTGGGPRGQPVLQPVLQPVIQYQRGAR